MNNNITCMNLVSSKLFENSSENNSSWLDDAHIFLSKFWIPFLKFVTHKFSNARTIFHFNKILRAHTKNRDKLNTIWKCYDKFCHDCRRFYIAARNKPNENRSILIWFQLFSFWNVGCNSANEMHDAAKLYYRIIDSKFLSQFRSMNNF